MLRKIYGQRIFVTLAYDKRSVQRRMGDRVAGLHVQGFSCLGDGFYVTAGTKEIDGIEALSGDVERIERYSSLAQGQALLRPAHHHQKMGIRGQGIRASRLELDRVLNSLSAAVQSSIRPGQSAG